MGPELPRNRVANPSKSLLIVILGAGRLAETVDRRLRESSAMSLGSRKLGSKIFVFGGSSRVTPSMLPS